MSQRPRLDIAEVFRRHAAAVVRTARISSAQHRVIDALISCRTAALGGHVDRCDRCGHEQICYNSCRNRHCPKCQASATAQWLEAERSNLLPVPYAHVVFTLPQLLAPLALQNPRVLYSFLFRAASETLVELAKDPRHLGARIGVLAILHTWGQTLLHHPHLHCLVPAGGLSPDGQRWIACKPGFFLPARVLSRVFRGKFLALLERAYLHRRLSFHGSLANLQEPAAFRHLLRCARAKDWVVYAKPPFGGPEQALKYLARYTHRVAIANSRLISIDETNVTFSWKDYAHHARTRTMTLPATEFIRRFLLHVLPPHFVRIRHFGFLSNRARAVQLAQCRTALAAELSTLNQCASDSISVEQSADSSPEEERAVRCPACHEGYLRTAGIIEPKGSAQRSTPLLDTS